MKFSEVRVRFAPSPSGLLHIGSARIALINYLFAKNKKGKMILRIEDTDILRSTKEHSEKMLETLSWLGISWDEGPYYQSHRMPFYLSLRDKLIKENQAYRCFCQQEQLQYKREQMIQKGADIIYDGTCRKLSNKEIQQNLEQGKPYIIRLKVKDTAYAFLDMIKGNVHFNGPTIGDFVLFRSDGSPTYQFAVVADDAEMEISHVIRGEDHLPNTPKQIALYHALGFPVPFFAHVPLILGSDKTKLSKRHGETSIEEFREKGICAKAILSYLYHIGYSIKTENALISKEEMIDNFNVALIAKSSSVFDYSKLKWFNSQWIKNMETKQLMTILEPLLNSLPLDNSLVERIITLSKHQAGDLNEFRVILKPFICYELNEDIPSRYETLFNPLLIKAIKLFFHKVFQMEHWDKEEMETIFSEMLIDEKIKKKDLIQLIRYAVTGKWISPPLFETMDIIGRNELNRRYTIFMRKYHEKK